MNETVIDTFEKPGEYRVELEVFNGPLDLLLHLIKKEEVDIYDIPLARITRQYLHYMELIEKLNLEVAGDFILMAATLIRIKTRLLLPRDENDESEGDPREELIMALVEYRKYREAGEILRDRAQVEVLNFVPSLPLGELRENIDFSPASTVWDLVTAFRDVMSVRKEEISHDVVPEEISIQDRMGVILDRLQKVESATFVELFEDIQRRIVAVVTFIAILELARVGRIRLFQSAPFAQLRVYRGERFDIPLTEDEMLAFTTVTEQVIENE